MRPGRSRDAALCVALDNRMATRDRQKAWLALNRDPEQTPPPQWQLKAWLLGGAEISTNAALFDEALHQVDIVTDLFGEERYFIDPDEFWRLQNAAIADEQARLIAAGWAEVCVIARTSASRPGNTKRRPKPEAAWSIGEAAMIRHVCCPTRSGQALRSVRAFGAGDLPYLSVNFGLRCSRNAWTPSPLSAPATSPADSAWASR